MANGIPDFRVTQQFPIVGAAQLLQQRPVLEEQIAASQQQRELEPLEFALKAAQVGSDLASQSLERAATRQSLKIQQERQRDIAELAAGAEAQFGPQIQNVQGQISALDQLSAARLGQQPIQQFLPRTVRAQGPPTAAGQIPTTPLPPLPTGQVTPTLGQTQRFGPGIQAARPALQQQVTGLQQQQRLTGAFARVAPKEFIKAQINQKATDTSAEALRLLRIKELKGNLATEGPAVDALKQNLVKTGFDPGTLEGQTVSQLTKLNAVNSSAILAGSRKTMADTLRAKFGEQISKTTMSAFIALANKNNVLASNNVQIRQQANRLISVQRLSIAIQNTQGNPFDIQMREISSALAAVVQGGGNVGRIAKEQIDELTPSTLKGKLNQQLQWIINRPVPLDQQKFVKAFAKLALREGQAIERDLRQGQAQDFTAKKLLKNRNPLAFRELAQDLGIDLDKITSKGRYLIDEEYQTILPNFNPFDLTVNELMEGISLTPGLDITGPEGQTAEDEANAFFSGTP